MMHYDLLSQGKVIGRVDIAQDASEVLLHLEDEYRATYLTLFHHVVEDILNRAEWQAIFDTEQLRVTNSSPLFVRALLESLARDARVFSKLTESAEPSPSAGNSV